MDEKTKELIAIGASVTANCVPCLKYHVEKAREIEASDDEIHTAVSVGRMVRRGAAGKWDEEAKALLRVEPPSETKEEGQACGSA